jgi:hypothetical protein
MDSEYPHEIRSSTQHPSTIYKRLPDHYAVLRLLPDRSTSNDTVTTMVEGEGVIEVFRGEGDQHQRELSPSEILPVYSLQPGGVPFVPTGRVFIRFKDNVRVEKHLLEIGHAGYEVTQKIDYAPHAAWLKVRSGKIADSLKGIQGLEKITDVENVEPQMLTQRTAK